MKCDCQEHRCTPHPIQTERYPIPGGYELCAACYTLGHMAGVYRLAEHYAGLLP